jgi:hypothetical protein
MDYISCLIAMKKNCFAVLFAPFIFLLKDSILFSAPMVNPHPDFGFLV